MIFIMILNVFGATKDSMHIPIRAHKQYIYIYGGTILSKTLGVDPRLMSDICSHITFYIFITNCSKYCIHIVIGVLYHRFMVPA